MDRTRRDGTVGAGHAVEAINNTLLAANLWAASEGLAALAKLGVADGAVPAPILREVVAMYQLAASELGPDVDHSAAVRLVERWSGIELTTQLRPQD